jgi:uncharacterized protein YjbI with pentapeptide repeats
MRHISSLIQYVLSLFGLICSLLLAVGAFSATGEEVDPCSNRKKVSYRQLSALQDSRLMLSNDWQRQLGDLTHADLSDANLTKVKLAGQDLTCTNLGKSNLSNALMFGSNLTNAKLTGANLTNANMWASNLTNADLSDADLTGADLSDANLSNANLTKANLTNANLGLSNLTDAQMIETNLSGTVLKSATINGVIFEPASIPTNAFGFSGTTGLSKLKYKNSRHGLVALRELFQKSGMREQEREVTYAVKRGDRLWFWEQDNIGYKIDSIFNLILFELPSAYGMYPGRPLRILGVSIALFSVPYMFALSFGRGLNLVWPKELARDDDPHAQAGTSLPARPQVFFPHLGRRHPHLRDVIDKLAIIVVGFYFSVISTFHIGWREYSLGPWLARIQPREYTIVPVGWVRTVAGIQSIMSVYLIALWALTYFGRPFE